MKTGLTAAALLSLLAIGACGQSVEPEAESITTEQAAVDLEPKFIGLVGQADYEVGGDAILTTVRDVAFNVEGDRSIEVFVTTVDSDLHLQLVNGMGEVVAEVDAPAGQETRLAGPATGGEPGNVIRLTRPAPTGNIAAFSFRIRAL